MSGTLSSSSSYSKGGPSPGLEPGSRMIRPTEVFPDLHHKMSKKIAQLTKVIYHLNSKNEDHQMDLESANANHQNEIEQILRDASKKINKFKDQLETKKIELNAEAKLEKFRQKYNAEKQQALEELQRVKQEAKRKADESQEDHRHEMASLRDEVTKAKGAYEVKLKELRDAGARLKDAFDRKRLQIEETCSAEKAKSSKELEEMVKEYNDKYKAMLVEQMAAQDKLRVECEKTVEQTHKDLSAQWQSSMDKLRSEVETDRDTKLHLQARTHEEQCRKTAAEHEALRLEMLGKIEMLAQKALKLQTGSEAVAETLSQTEATLSDTRVALQQARAEASMLKEELEGGTVREAGLKALLMQRERDLEAASSRADELSSFLNHEQQEVQVRTSSNDGLQRSLKEALDRYDALKANMSAELARKDEALARKEGDLEVIRRSLTDVSSSSELRVVEVQHRMEQSQKASEAEINRLLGEATLLREELKSSKLGASVEREGMAKTVASLEENVRCVKADLEACKQHMVMEREEHEQALRRTEEEWASKMGSVQKEAQTRAETAQRDHEVHVATIAQAEERLQERLKNLEADLAQEKVRGEEERKALLGRIDDQGRSGNVQMSKLQEDLSKEREEVRTLRVALEKQLNQGELERLKVEELQGLAKALGQEREEAVEKERTRATAHLQQLMEGWEDKSQKLRQAWEEASVQKQWEMDAHVSELTAEHDRQVHQLQRNLQEAEAMQAMLQMELSRSRQTGEGEVQALRAKREQELKTLADAHTQEVARIKHEHDRELLQTQERLKSQFEAERQRLQALQQQERERQQVDLGEREKVAKWQLEVKIAELRREHEEDRARALRTREQELQQAAEQARLTLSQTLQQQIDKLQQDAATVSKTLRTEQSRGQELSQKLAEVQEALQAARRAHREAVDGMQLDFQESERLNRVEHGNQIRQVEEQFRRELQMARQEWAGEKRMMEDAKQFVQSQLEAMTARYHSRESRTEDVRHIEQLQQRLSESETQKKRAVEEMMYFKLELINREECYNKIFARSPNVGIMQAIKQTKHPSPAPHGASGMFTQASNNHSSGGNVPMTGRSSHPDERSQHPQPPHRRRATMPAIPIPTGHLGPGKVQSVPSHESHESTY